MLINLRNALMAGKRTPTAKDYVQNGLVAMWDGIENAGWGTHDASSFPINLVSGIADVPWNNFSSITQLADSLVITGNTTVRSQQGFDLGSTLPYATVEWNVGLKRADNTVSTLNLWLDFGSDATAQSANIFLQNSQLRFARGNYYSAYGKAVASDELCSGVFSLVASVDKSSDTNYNLAQYYENADLKVSTNTSNWVFNSFNITNPAKLLVRVLNGTELIMRNIRLYSRALTADEIAANYAIDKARFGLP